MQEDLAPSILFAILYGFLVPLAAFRILGRSSRTTLLLGTIAFSIERPVPSATPGLSRTFLRLTFNDAGS